MKRLLILVAAVIVGFFVWSMLPLGPDTRAGKISDSIRARTAEGKTDSRPALTGDAAFGSAAAERSDLADALNSPATEIRADLRLVATVIDTFRSNFPHVGNPTGNNAEITAALTGKNKLRLSLIPSDHPAINRDGELCDRWGTPFFFHAASANTMEVRSAGPDRKMWNDDDVTFTP